MLSACSRDQKSNQSGLGIILQIQTRADIKIVLPTIQTPHIQHGDHADTELRLWNLDTIKGTGKNDTIDSTQNACFIVQTKRKHKKKTQPSRNDEDEKDQTANHSDQDSDISFMKDTDEEIDTGEIEEEDWIEYMKRSTATAVDRMKTAKVPCWIATRRRMKWRLAMKIASLPYERWAKKAAEWNPGLSTRQTEQWEDQKSDAKMK